MSEIMLHPTSANCITCIPDYFIDEYMVEANGEYVKIYLYLLRCLSRSTFGFSISKIADALDHTQKDVRKALHYWADKGLLELEYNDCDELTCIYLKEPEVLPSQPKLEIVHSPAAKTTSAPEEIVAPALIAPAPVIPAGIVSDEIYEDVPAASPMPIDEELKELLYVAEKLMRHPLTPEHIDAIISWHDSLGLSWDLIDYVIEYSVDKGGANIRYMEKVATAWANEGIRTVDEAKTHNNAYLSIAFAVKSAFGITGRNLAQAELEYVNKWIGEYGFPNDIITEACRRTILKTHAPSFEYTDSILRSWFNSGVKTVTDLDHLDELFTQNKTNPARPATGSKNRFTDPVTGRKIDYKELEKTLRQS